MAHKIAAVKISSAPGATVNDRMVISASPAKARNTVAAALALSRRRSQIQAISGAKTTVVPVTNAEINTEVVCMPTVQSTKPLPSSAPSTAPRVSVRRSICCRTRGRSPSRVTVANTKRQPRSPPGLTSPTVALTTTKLTPHVTATPSTATAAGHRAGPAGITSRAFALALMCRPFFRALGTRAAWHLDDHCLHIRRTGLFDVEHVFLQYSLESSRKQLIRKLGSRSDY